ncbi:ArsR family transcriptional regulator [Halobacillus salinarum]|uniref:ArsR family transcriptional regulator n=1 Tax=Halobacillus salinarum TaxID=2932257 RepID=A0ABY4EEE7_9BACI|nr:ArsR family transcriptional regulator [Halobacillus salinarum]UOQ42850.1 ArsR family transcriptional regulator [Halobacillus salinarum]
MDVYSMKTKERETYHIELKSSLLWEAALGIAAFTNERLIETLDLEKKERKKIKDSLSQSLKEKLDEVKSTNTWKAILQLLHQEDFSDLSAFQAYVKNLPSEEFKRIAIPHLGRDQEGLISEMLDGSKEALRKLQESTKNNSFLPSYFSFIFNADLVQVKKHIVEVMSEWYEQVISPEKESLQSILARDLAAKKRMLEKLQPEAFVHWATGGMDYKPEPGVYSVIMIPQYIYRPWNVEADLEGAKVIYYPVANESITPDNKYVPNQMLIQRYKALGDQNRLKILKMLTEKERTLHELTEELLLGKTTVHHHLKLLKSARLVFIESNQYVVNARNITSLPEELKQFLEQE